MGASVFLHLSGYKGSEPFKGPEPGSNGMTLDANGLVSVAGHAERTVWQMESVTPRQKSRFWPTRIKARSSVNVASGDKDGKTLCITSTSLFRIKLKIPGVRS